MTRHLTLAAALHYLTVQWLWKTRQTETREWTAPHGSRLVALGYVTAEGVVLDSGPEP